MLVSVLLITYNSSRFVLEALDSIHAQSWQDLELIISDDCSNDNTVEICEAWLEQNKERFARTELITVEFNSGIAANCSRALVAARGEWLKYCAGDDALLSDCIANNMEYIQVHTDTRILFSYTRMYRDKFQDAMFIRLNPVQPPVSIMNEVITPRIQYHRLLVTDCITYTPSSFIHRQTLIGVGGFNQQSQIQEDYPLWLRMTKAGYKLHFMEKETVLYRQHDAATNNMKIDYLIKPNYFRTEPFRRENIYPNLPWDVRGRERFVWIVSQLFRNSYLNKNKKLNRQVYSFISVYLNPFRAYIYLKKRVVKELKDEEFYL